MKQLIILTVAAFVLAGASPERSALVPSPATTAVAPMCNISPNPLNFGNVCVGTTKNQNLTVSNSGSPSFSITGVTSSNPAFTVISPLPITVASGGSATVTVRMSCSSPGSQSGTLTFSTNPAAGCPAVSVSGSCVQSSTCTVSPTTLNFGNVCVGSSANQSFTVTNTGGPVTINAITSSNAAFTIVSPSLPITVAGGVLTVTVKMSCSSSGSQSGTLTFSTSSACGSVSCSPVSVSGSCAVQDINVSPTSLTFGNQCINTTSATQTVTVSNTSSCTLIFTGDSNSNPTDFFVQSFCGVSLGPGQNCTYQVQFDPETVGAKSGTLTIQSNDPDEPTRTVSLSGTAIAQDISLSTTSLTFGNQCINTTSAPQTVTVSNPSACTLTVTTITNSNSTDFDYTGPTSQTVAPGGNFTFTVAFDPETMGAKSGTITIASNDPDESTVTVSLSGTSLDTTPPTVSCPGAMSASANASCQAAIPDVRGNVTASDNCTPSASLTKTQNPPAGTLVGLGTHTITVTVTDQAGNSSACTTTFTVNATTPTCAVSSTTLDFGNVRMGDSDERTFMVNNAGIVPFTINSISSSNPAFSVVSPAGPTTVPAGSNVPVTVRFTCSVSGAQSGILSISASSQCGGGPVSCASVSVSGACTLLACETMEPTIDFGLVPVGSNPTAIATAINTGNVPFTLTAVRLTNSSRFRIVSTSRPLPVVLNPGESLTARVAFDCISLTQGSPQGSDQLVFVTQPDARCPPVALTGVCTGEERRCGQTPIPTDTGCTAVEARTGAAMQIPSQVLETEAVVKILTLDSPAALSQIDNSCGVPIESGESFPDVPGWVRATEVVRYEAQPCGALAFGPGTRLILPLRRSRFPGGLSFQTPPLRLFELVRSGGRLAFADTGISAQVTGPGSVAGSGDFASAAGIPVFSTFAAFMPASGSVEPPASVEQVGSERLYFPIIHQQAGRQTRLSIANPDASAALNVTFMAYTEAGALAGVESRRVAANRQTSFVVSELFPGFTSGAIIAERQGGGGMVGFYELADDFVTPTMLGGATGIHTPSSTLVFPVIKSSGGAVTQLHLFNPNAARVSLKLAGFTVSGTRVNPTNSAGQPLDTILLPAFATLILSSRGVTSPYDVRLDFARLDGGYVIAETTDGQAMTGGEFFGENIGGQPTVAVLNGLPLPSGCLPSTTERCACHVDASPESPTPSAIRQYTLYAPYVESSPAEAILTLVNVSDSPADVAFTVFSELGQFRATNPPRGFMTLNPHQVFQASVINLFGFNPSPGYVRVEDPHSSVVGAIINRATTAGRYVTVVPLVPDDPRVTPVATNTYFSRVQLDPESAPSRQLTGLLLFNPNNNHVQFRVAVIDPGGTLREQLQTVVARGTYVRAQRSLGVLFPGINRGYAQVDVPCAPGQGLGGRLIVVAVYRTNQVVSTVPQQNRPPE